MSRVSRPALLLLSLVPLLSLAFTPNLTPASPDVRRALSQVRSPRGASQLLRLHSLKEELESLEPLAAIYRQVLARSDTDPGTRDTARILLLDLSRAQGNLTEASRQSQALGFISDFYVAGAFDNEGKSGCDTDFGPEAGPLSLSTRYPASQGKEASWRKLPVASGTGYVDLATALRPNKEVVAYALTYLQVSKPQRVELHLGTSGAFRLWVNGEKVASEDRYNLPRPDQARVSVQLRRGENPVLLKVCQVQGPLGFYLRAPQVRAILPAEWSPPPPGAPVAPTRLPTVTEALAKAVAQKPKDALLRADYATALGYFRTYDEKERSVAVEAERAALEAPGNVDLQLLAAAAQEEDFNARRKFLDAALKADPTSVDARIDMARHELERAHPERAQPLLAAVVHEEPRSAAARLSFVRALEQLGERPRAQALLEESVRLLPRSPGLARAAATASRMLDRPKESVERLRDAIALRMDDRGSRRTLASQLADLGEIKDAEAELRALLTYEPFDNGTRVTLAELLAANGQSQPAFALFDEAKALSPDEPDLHEREGRALLAAGRRNEALKAFERSLSLRPQNPGLKEALRTLKGEGQGTSPYHVQVKPLLQEAQAKAYANEDALILVDATYVRVQRSGLSSRVQQLAVKVQTQRGVEAFRSVPISYSPDRQEVRVLMARVLRPDGSVVESHAEAERNLNEPWTGMYYDQRAKILSFPGLAPGDVLELEYRLEDTAADNLLSDYWGNVDSVQSTQPKLRYQFVVEMPKERPLYWNAKELPGLSHQVQPLDEGRTLYRWTASQVAKQVPEPMMPGWAEVSTTLHVSTYKTWEQVGRYYWGLVQDQLTPNAELKQTVDSLLGAVDRKDTHAVVQRLYNFVVTHTRYVALEFGIHGYKPYRVGQVLSRRFGDCKDKASLLYALLKVAGVDSRLVLLRMRHLGALGEEPASLAAFNHAILYVPQLGLYLDGTAEFHGLHELPSSDHVANVLIIEPDGKSTFRTTPESKAEDNRTQLSMQVAVQADGSAQVKGGSRFVGLDAPEYRRAYLAPATRRSTFERAWGKQFPGISVEDIQLSDTTQLDREVALDFRMRIPRYAEVLPQSLRFLPFGGGRSYTQGYAALAQRHFDLVMPKPWTHRFELKHTPPPGFRVSVPNLPAPFSEETPFGRVSLSHRVDPKSQELISTAEVVFSQARVSAKDYPAFRAFLSRMDQAFGRKVLFEQGPQQAPSAVR